MHSQKEATSAQVPSTLPRQSEVNVSQTGPGPCQSGERPGHHPISFLRSFGFYTAGGLEFMVRFTVPSSVPSPHGMLKGLERKCLTINILPLVRLTLYIGLQFQFGRGSESLIDGDSSR